MPPYLRITSGLTFSPVTAELETPTVAPPPAAVFSSPYSPAQPQPQLETNININSLPTLMSLNNLAGLYRKYKIDSNIKLIYINSN